ncbi:hypothetical protein B0H14DRAFT_3566574 [Mycena olivaceomarginata]|nr:hypothetical protein B0H14DRAFT_3566574 [Mycena olivaceomarginata]
MAQGLDLGCRSEAEILLGNPPACACTFWEIPACASPLAARRHGSARWLCSPPCLKWQLAAAALRPKPESAYKPFSERGIWQGRACLSLLLSEPDPSSHYRLLQPAVLPLCWPIQAGGVFPKAIAAPGVLFSCLYNVSGPLQASPNLFYPQPAPSSGRPPAPLAACRGTWTRSISSSTSLPASLGADNPLNALPRSTDPALARTVSRRPCGPAVTQSTSPNHCPTSSTSYTWLVGPPQLTVGPPRTAFPAACPRRFPPHCAPRYRWGYPTSPFAVSLGIVARSFWRRRPVPCHWWASFPAPPPDTTRRRCTLAAARLTIHTPFIAILMAHRPVRARLPASRPPSRPFTPPSRPTASRRLARTLQLHRRHIPPQDHDGCCDTPGLALYAAFSAPPRRFTRPPPPALPAALARPLQVCTPCILLHAPTVRPRRAL